MHGGAISDETLMQGKRVLRNASRECVEIEEGDRVPWETRHGTAFVLAVRPWNYSGFAQFDRQANLRQGDPKAADRRAPSQDD